VSVYREPMWKRLRRRLTATTLETSEDQQILGVRAVDDTATEPGKVDAVNDQLDVSVHDGDVLNEIEMMTNLIIATSESEGPLPQTQIDAILGVAEPDHS